MRLTSFASLAALASLALLPSALSAQCATKPGNLVANCSFESPTLPSQPGNYPYFPNAPLTGWTATPTGNVERWIGPYEGISSKDGNTHVELNVNAPTSLWQQLSTVGGATYDLSFFGLHRPGGGNSFSQIDVFINDTFLYTTGQFGNTLSSPSKAWFNFNAAFVATGAQTKLEFRGMNNPGPTSFGNHLDDVSVVTRAVSEPGSLALLATGFLGLLSVARRRGVAR
jgi:hypothetical protein